MKVEICIEIEWPCPRCGHLHEQQVTLAIPKGVKQAVHTPTFCQLACASCGHQSPLQISLATADGLAIRTPSSIDEPWVDTHHHRDVFLKSWNGAARNPCPN